MKLVLCIYGFIKNQSLCYTRKNYNPINDCDFYFGSIVMEKNTTIIIVLIMLVGACATGFSPLIKSNNVNDSDPTPPDIITLKSDRSGIKLDFNLNGLIIEEKEINGEVFHLVSIPGYGFLDDIGKPKMPAIRFFIAVPPEVSDIDLDLANTEYIIYTGYNLYPVQQPVPESKESDDFTIDSRFYSQNIFYPEQSISIVSDGYLRDYKFIFLEFCPVSFNPATNEIKVIESTDIIVNFNDYSKDYIGILRTGFEETYKTTFLNYDAAKNWYFSSELKPSNKQSDNSDLLNSSNRAGLLIITEDSFYSCIKPLADWKDKKGWETFIANISTVYSQFPAGNGIDSIYNFISYTFTNWSRTPSHVLLIGDVEYIPTSYYQGDTASDHWYSLILGSDYLSDIFVGRICVKNCNEVTDVVNKIINYEKDPYLTETDWYKKAMLVSDSGYFETTSDWVYSFLTGFNYAVDKFYASMGTATPSNIANAINEGRAIANYRGHGGTTGWATGSFYNSDVLLLTNGKKLPIVISPTCSTGHFDDPGTDCFGETWLKAADRGGVTFWGSSRVSYGGYNDELDMGVYKAIFNDNIFDFGGFTNEAKLYMVAVYGTSSMAVLELHLFNVIGDSTLEFWTDVPQSMTVSHPTTIPPQSSTFTVTVTNGTTPIENATVVIQKENEVCMYDYTDSLGQAQFTLPLLSLGQIEITVTKHDYIPYLGNATVYNGITINKDWNLISLPFNQTTDKQDILIWHNENLYTWQDAVASNLVNDYIFGWDRATQSYTFTDTLEPGNGYWMYASDTSELWIQGYALYDSYITSIEPNWNIIGIPGSEPMSKTDIIVNYGGTDYTWNDAVSTGLLNNYLFGWNSSSQSYGFTDTFQPGYAYWVYAYQPCTLKRAT